MVMDGTLTVTATMKLGSTMTTERTSGVGTAMGMPGTSGIMGSNTMTIVTMGISICLIQRVRCGMCIMQTSMSGKLTRGRIKMNMLAALFELIFVVYLNVLGIQEGFWGFG